MPRYWVIAPYDSQKSIIFENAWSYDLKHNTIAVGWNELTDATQWTKEQLESKFKEAFPQTTNRSAITRDVNTIWKFLHEISIGDVILARRGTKKLIGLGIVKGDPYYSVLAGKERVGNLSDAYYYPYLISVEWEQKEIVYDKIVFSFYTMYEIDEEKYRELIPSPTPIEQLPEFVMEKYLEEFIKKNFDKIFKGSLNLYSEEDDSKAQQLIMLDDENKDVGRLDLLAKDTSGNFVVIELKKGKETDKVIGQLLRYMGWVKEKLCADNQDVKGLVICKNIDAKLKYALMPVSDKITVKEYAMDFKLKD